MKAIKKIMMAMFVMACMGMTVSCNKDNENDNGNGNGNGNNYNTMLVGTWQIDRLTYNGQDMSQMMPNIQLSFNANGTGMMSDNGVTENNGFNWVINGNVITVTPHHGQYTFTIISMTSTECTFTGDYLEMAGVELSGNIEIHMVKVNGGDNPDPGPVTGSLEGTQWSYLYETTMTEDGYTLDVNITLGLNFTTSTTGIATEIGTIEVSVNGTVVNTDDHNANAPFTYTYNENTHTGAITVTATNDEGETEVTNMNFTYNPTDNTIIVVNTDYNPEVDMMPQTMIFHRVRK